MCRMLYIAADEPLPLIEWRDEAPAFWTSELQGREDDVRGQFTKLFVAFLGSHQGCSCGFVYEHDVEFLEDDEDHQEYAAKKESVRRLSDYVSQLVENGSVEIFACWDGEQADKPEERLIVTHDYFASDDFVFRDKQFFVVQKET